MLFIIVLRFQKHIKNITSRYNMMQKWYNPDQVQHAYIDIYVLSYIISFFLLFPLSLSLSQFLDGGAKIFVREIFCRNFTFSSYIWVFVFYVYVCIFAQNFLRSFFSKILFWAYCKKWFFFFLSTTSCEWVCKILVRSNISYFITGVAIAAAGRRGRNVCEFLYVLQ